MPSVSGPYALPRHRAAALAAAACIVLASCGEPNLKKIVGDWYLDEVEPGKPSPHLYWVKDGTRIVVDRHIRSYALPGCLVYETARPAAASVVFAVLTGKTPVAIATSDAFHPWHLAFDGLRRFDSPLTDGNGATSLGMDLIGSREICMRAYNQPPFKEDWAGRSSLDVTAIAIEHTVFAVNGADSVGNTTVSEQVRLRHPDVVEELIRAGGDVNAPNDAGITPLMTAIAFDAESTTIAERLLEAGADVNAQDKGGMTALMHAARYDRKGAVGLLLARGADPSIHDNQGRTAAAMTRDSDPELNRLLESAARRRK